MSIQSHLLNLANHFNRNRKLGGPRKRNYLRRLLVEQMEDRRMLAVIDLAAITAAQGATFQGVDANDWSGFSVGNAGDVNGDGLDDLIIGAPNANQLNNNQSFDGESYVIFGKAVWPSTIDLGNLGTSGFTIYGEDTGRHSGVSVSGAGDVNGDGFDDLIIGAPFGDYGSGKYAAGETNVIFGAASLPASIDLTTLGTPGGVAGIKIKGAEAYDHSGISVSNAGDVNGDGFDDLIIGAPNSNGRNNLESQAGESYVIFGGTSLSSTIELAVLGTNAGSAGVTIFGTDAGDQSGFSVSSAGDVNGDGFDDLLIGAKFATANNLIPYAGESYVVFGGASLPTEIDLASVGISGGSAGITIYGMDAYGASGFSVSNAGDVNGDGFEDLIIGAPYASTSVAGAGYVIFGQASPQGTIDLGNLGSNGIIVSGFNADEISGFSVSSAGDVDADGFDDFIVGARFADASGNFKLDAGETYVIFGGASLPGTINLSSPGSVRILTVFGASSGDQSGYAVSGAGDVNMDGFDDLIIGAAFSSANQAGKSYLIFGSQTFNSEPVALYGGPYSVVEGSSVLLSAANSHDADGSIVAYDWDFNYTQGFFDVDATGSTPTYSAAGIEGLIRTNIALRVTDNQGATSYSFGQIQVNEAIAAGSRDLTFGVDGLVTADSISPGSPHSVLVQADGKIVVAGSSDQSGTTRWDFAAARFNADGSLDMSFGVGGRVFIDFGSTSESVLNDFASGVAVQVDGKIVMAGYTIERHSISIPVFDEFGDLIGYDSQESNFSDFAVIRLNPDGSLDSSFGTNGKKTVDFDSDSDYSQDVAVQADGKIILGGYSTQVSTGQDFAIARLNSDGSLDSTFDGAGTQTFDFGADEAVLSMAALADGNIVLAGLSTQPANLGTVLVRLNATGTLDSTFDGDGKVTILDDLLGYALAVQSNGKLVLGGYSPAAANQDFVVARLNENGTLDGTFDGDGKQSVDFGASESLFGMTVQTNDKIVVVGYIASGSSPFDFAIARLTDDGQLDSSFSADGKRTIDFGSTYEFATGVTIQADGKIVVAGSGGSGVAVARLQGITDTDDDGIEDSVDTQPLVYSNDFSDGTTSGTITNRGDQNITIFDSPNSAEGLLITSDFLGGAIPATISITDEVVTRTLTVGLQMSITHISATPPTEINLSVSSIAENQPSGSLIGQFASVDPNINDAFYYTLVPSDGDSDNASFTIDSDKLYSAASFDFETKDNYTIRVRTTDLSGLTYEKNFSVYVADVAESIAPLIGAFDTTVTFTENGTAVLLDTNATLTDADSLDFVDGVMTVSLIANSEATDRLLIRNQGTGAGQIGVAGNQVTYSASPLATFAGGTSGDAPLVITLGAGGSKVAAQALLRNLTFSNLSESPSTLPRTVQVTLTDGDGGVTLPVTKTINVTAVNDAPVISNFSGIATYTEGDAAVRLGTAATISDVDSADFALGVLTVRVLVNSQTTDRLSIRNDGIAPGDIGVSGTNVLYGNVVIGSFTGTTTLIVTLNPNANAAAAQALLRNVSFGSISLAPSTLTRTISAALSDGDGGTSATVTTLVNVIAVNSAPTIGAFDTTVTYVENAAPVLLDTNATVVDVDSLDFNSGILSVTLTDNEENDDRLAVRNQGVAANQVGVIGNQLSFGGISIGSIFGGTSGSDPLQIVFNANATPTAVQSVLRNITFNNVSQNPSTLARIVEVQLTDGDGGTSDPATKTINVTAINNAPVISNFSGSVSYTEGDAPVLLAVTASVFDVDSTDFNLGRLTVSVSANSQTTDRVTITNEGVAPGQIGVSGSNVTYGGSVIGTFIGTTSLIVTLNANASQAAVQALVANIAFSSLSGAPSTLLRTISASLTDGDGGTSTTVSKTVQVFATNNDPVIGAFDTTVTFVENGVPVILDTNATVIDTDLLDFEDGVLTVSLIANGHANDRLEIRNQGVGANQIGVNVDEVTFGGVVIGTFSGGISGSDTLEILLNVSANQAAVQALVRNLTFRNVSEAPSTLVRTVALQLTDGDGGSSVPVTKLTNVTAVNDAPVITNFSGFSSYTENDIAVAIAIDAVVDDFDSADFDLGRLIASVSANSQSTDRITIRSDGTGLGQIGVSGLNVTYSGVVIGTFAGTTALTVTLNSAANKTAVQALLRNISFSSLSDAPSTLQRTITATLSDGDGGTSLAVTTIVEVIAVNDAPVVGAFTPDITYVENAVPLLIDNNATITDVDSLDFALGFMTVSLTANGHADDRLSIRNQGPAANQIGVNGNRITYSGVEIGTFLGGTSGLTPLQITFNPVASKTAVQSLVRNLTYSNVSDNPSTLPRTVSLTVNDGDGGTSIPVTKIINVTAVNDAPTIGAFGGNVGYAIGGPAVVLDSDATVDDPDTGTFNLGVLTVALTTNKQTTDRVEILSVGTGLGQISVLSNQVFYEGVLIGTFGGTTTLTVTLNANASKAAVQKLLRSITFRSLSVTPSLLSRTVSATLSDGAGGTSIAQTKVIDML